MKVTRTQLGLLHTLRFREAGQSDPKRQVCWLGRQPRNRWLLIVPTLMGTWEPLRSLNGATLADLEAGGLIEYSPDGQLPEHVARGGVTFGSTVQLTDAGRAHLGRRLTRPRPVAAHQVDEEGTS